MSSYAILGIIAGILAFAANPVYVWSIFKGRTKPDRVTWWILAFLNALITLELYALGARETLWLPIGYTISFTIIALLSLKYGEGERRLTRLQIVCVVGALTSAGVWWLSGSALIALLLTIVIDFLGIVPTIVKAYFRPWHESTSAWIITTIASVFNILAIHTWTFDISVYPVYVLATNAFVLYLIVRTRPTTPDTRVSL